jgi:peptidoglycan lytic transglycosylase A
VPGARDVLKSKWIVILAGIVAIAIVAGGVWYFWGAELQKEDRLVLVPSDFGDLSGWQDDKLVEFLPALHKSCEKIAKLPDNRSLGADGLAGTAGDWKVLCADALTLVPDTAVIRAFIEKNFVPVQVRNNDSSEGLFTGYYEASLKGSRVQSEIYKTPLYLRPEELVMVHLGRFRDSLKGQRIAGLVKNGELYPFASRKEIDGGALANRDLEIVWVDSAVDAFFLHIQGSGYVEMDDGSSLRVGYAAQNGHPYYAIGRTLIEDGSVAAEDMSMQAIRDWLDTHPDKADALMQENASYIFFRELKTSGPIGAQGVELTPRRSLAVDRKFMPLGVPIWLETEVFSTPGSAQAETFHHLMMAQDTGGAIRGPVRGDVFWGHGEDAYSRAGAMKSDGQYWILLPKEIATQKISKNLS